MRNRGFMTWYFGVVEAARDGVMQASAYDVIRSVPGWSTARVVNYNASRYDSQPTAITPTTTWFYDKAGTDGHIDPAYGDSWADTVFGLTQSMPREWLNPQPGVAWMDGVNNGHGRWGSGATAPTPT